MSVLLPINPNKQLAFSEAEWAARNPVLRAGEIGFDSTNQKLKIGDGLTPWNSLPTVSDAPRSAGSTQWSAENPILPAGQVAYDSDFGDIKIGNGSTPWNALPFRSLAPPQVRRSSETIVIGDSIDSADREWFGRLCMKSNQQVTWIRSAGVGGDRTEHMLARLQSDVIDYQPDICIIGGITNDTGQAGYNPTNTRANIQSMTDQLRASGIYVVARNTPPINAPVSGGGTVNQRRDRVIAHNLWIEDWGRQEGVPILDIFTPLVDPTTNGGLLGSLASDTVHPNEAGHDAIANHLIAVGLPDIFKGHVELPQCNSGVGGWLTHVSGGNFLMLDSASGKASRYTVQNIGDAATFSIVDDDDSIPGNWQKIVNPGLENAALIMFPTIGQFEVGATYETVCRLKVLTHGTFIRIGGTTEGNKPFGYLHYPIDGIVRVKWQWDGSTSVSSGMYVRDIAGAEGQFTQLGIRRLS